MQQQSEKGAGTSGQKLKLANTCERGMALDGIGDVVKRAAPENGPDPGDVLL